MSGSGVVVGGSGFIGRAVASRLVAQGRSVVSVDRFVPAVCSAPGLASACIDLLTDDLTVDVALPPGPLFLLAGASDPRANRPWQLVLDNAITTARLLPALAERDVTLISSVEVYGAAPGPLTETTVAELPAGPELLGEWCRAAVELAAEPCPPWRAARLCRDLADLDPTGRWVYALAKAAQEMLVASVVPPERLTVFRVANVFGPGQDRMVARVARRAMAGLPVTVTDTRRTFIALEDLAEAIARGGPPGVVNAGVGTLPLREVAALVLDDLGIAAPMDVRPADPGDSSGVVDTRAFHDRAGPFDDGHLERTLRQFVRRLAEEPLAAIEPAVPVVVPPRPEQPDVVGERIQTALWSGVLKAGATVATLTDSLRSRLQVTDDKALLLTSSGTAALRLAVLAVAGSPGHGAVAVVPSFTFVATAEALAQLGYRLRFCDVRADTWTLDAEALDRALAPGDVGVVVAVDTLGAPADYVALTTVCRRHGVPLVADSAPSLGATHQGRPVGTQADAHAFSMSFAKVVSAGGGGGAVVLPVDRLERLRRPVDWTRSAMLGEVHAAAALDLVDNLEVLTRRRQRVAAVYAELAAAASGVLPQQVAAGDTHAMVHWVARFPGIDRDRFVKELDALGVATKPYYAPALHTLDWEGHAEPVTALPATQLPVTELLDREALALPMSSELSVGGAEQVFWTVLSALRSSGDARP